MDSLSATVMEYWWVIVLPVILMVCVWLLRGAGLKLLFLLCFVVLIFFYFSYGTPYGVGTALNYFLNCVIQIIRQTVASVF